MVIGDDVTYPAQRDELLDDESDMTQRRCRDESINSSIFKRHTDTAGLAKLLEALLDVGHDGFVLCGKVKELGVGNAGGFEVGGATFFNFALTSAFSL